MKEGNGLYYLDKPLTEKTIYVMHINDKSKCTKKIKIDFRQTVHYSSTDVLIILGKLKDVKTCH